MPVFKDVVVRAFLGLSLGMPDGISHGRVARIFLELRASGGVALLGVSPFARVVTD